MYVGAFDPMYIGWYFITEEHLFTFFNLVILFTKLVSILSILSKICH